MFMPPFPVRDANASSGGKNLGPLPEWDLSDLYASPDAPELERDLDWLKDACARFAADYEGKLAQLDAAGLLDCLQRDEAISRTAGRIMSYAGLRYYQQTTDGARAKFLSDCQEKVTNYTTPLVFFSLELNRLDEGALEAMYAERRSGALCPGPAPHPRDETLSALGRAGEVPARSGRCRRCLGAAL